jgi:hypothetical protein
MRTTVVITIALLLLLVSSCAAQPDGNAPSAPVSSAVPQAPTETPPPPATLDAGSLSAAPTVSTAALPTSLPDSPSTLTTDEIATTTGIEAVIDVAAIRLRAGPGLSYDQLQTVRAGERYQVLGKSSSGIWFQLDAASGAGWIPARYVVLEGDGNAAPVVADDLGAALPLGQTPLPKATNTPIAAAPPPPPPASRPPSAAPTTAPGSSGPPAPPSSLPTATPPPAEQPTVPASAPIESDTPIAATAVPHAPVPEH